MVRRGLGRGNESWQEELGEVEVPDNICPELHVVTVNRDLVQGT